MAIKSYNITQHVTANGSRQQSSFQFKGEESELTALLALLEGGYTVSERNDSLSNMTAADTNVTAYRRCTKISMTSEADANGQKAFSQIKPFKGVIALKTTSDDQAIESALLNAHAFPIAPTLKVAQVYANTSYEGAASE